MLKTSVLHPEILEALGGAGHGSKVLISDGNFPHSTRLGPNASLVFANFAPGLLDAVTVLKLITQLIPIEAAEVMQPNKGGAYTLPGEPEIWADYRKVLADEAGFEGDLSPIDRFGFYDAAEDKHTCLVVATGEQRIYANLLLTIGVVMPEA